jgi:hypothetical protein
MANAETHHMAPENRLKIRMRAVAGVGIAIFAATYFSRVAWLALHEAFWKDLALKHFPAMVGLPAAALAATFLILTFEAVSGDIEFKALGFEFKGASGPIVLWVVCFLSIPVAIRLLWIPS